ncbi:MAG: hypothetical protein AAFW81_01135 [Pseudomonadota bacterium]
MTQSYQPFGPFYLALLIESADQTEPATVYIDGFRDEAAAWRACYEIGREDIKAIDTDGTETAIPGGDILQVVIAKSAFADERKDAVAVNA